MEIYSTYYRLQQYIMGDNFHYRLIHILSQNGLIRIHESNDSKTFDSLYKYCYCTSRHISPERFSDLAKDRKNLSRPHLESFLLQYFYEISSRKETFEIDSISLEQSLDSLSEYLLIERWRARDPHEFLFMMAIRLGKDYNWLKRSCEQYRPTNYHDNPINLKRVFTREFYDNIDNNIQTEEDLSIFMNKTYQLYDDNKFTVKELFAKSSYSKLLIFLDRVKHLFGIERSDIEYDIEDRFDKEKRRYSFIIETCPSNYEKISKDEAIHLISNFNYKLDEEALAFIDTHFAWNKNNIKKIIAGSKPVPKIFVLILSLFIISNDIINGLITSEEDIITSIENLLVDDPAEESSPFILFSPDAIIDDKIIQNIAFAFFYNPQKNPWDIYKIEYLSQGY